MKGLNTSLIKDFFISCLIVACIVLILSIIFYDKISLTKVIPQSVDYEVSNEMQEDIDKTLSEDGTEIVTTYYIDAADLKRYEKTNEYNKGKKNPFAATSEDVTQENEISDSNNFYEDDGTK